MPYNRPIPDNKPRGRFSSGIETLVQAEKLMQIALLLPSSVFIGWLAGASLDLHFHRSWIALVGMVFGGISGLVYVVRLVISSGGDSGSGKDGKSSSGRGNPEIEP